MGLTDDTGKRCPLLPCPIPNITNTSMHMMQQQQQQQQMVDHASTYTMDEALLPMGFGKFQAFLLAYSGMGWISEAMEMMLLSFVGPSVQEIWKLSAQEQSLITSVVFVGMLIGAFSWGLISDIYGRRIGFLFTAIITGVAGFLSAFAPNYIALIVLRFLVGIGLGGGPVLSAWFLEFVPSPNRGAWMVVFSAFWSVGTILEASLAWAVMPKMGWRWLLALSSTPSFLLLLLYWFTPESPRYLCMKGKTTDAMQVLERMAKWNHVSLPSGRLVSDHSCVPDENPASSAGLDSITIQRHDTNIDDSESKRGGITSLFRILSRKLLRTTLLLWMVIFGCAFAYYGIILLTSELSSGNKRCSSNKLHLKSDGSGLYKNVLITSLAEIPGLFIAATIVDRIGRKLTMSSMLFVSCILLIPLVSHQKEVLTVGLLFGARMLISGSFTIVYIYAPEVYPTSTRTTGVGVASAVGRVGGIVCPLVAVGLVHGCHQTAAVLLFELVILLAAAAICFFPFETSRRYLLDSVHNIK